MEKVEVVNVEVVGLVEMEEDMGEVEEEVEEKLEEEVGEEVGEEVEVDMEDLAHLCEDLLEGGDEDAAPLAVVLLAAPVVADLGSQPRGRRPRAHPAPRGQADAIQIRFRSFLPFGVQGDEGDDVDEAM